MIVTYVGCSDISGEDYPCLGALIALRGNDSSVLWTIHTHAWMFELNCGNIDINKDGKMDCVGTGRFGTIVAFDPRNGIHLILCWLTCFFLYDICSGSLGMMK